MLIKDLPHFKKPREKLIEKGVKALSTNELLTIVLGTGNRKNDVVQLAQNITSRGKLTDIARLSVLELATKYEVGLVNACKVLAALELGSMACQDQESLVINKPHLVFQLAQEISTQKQEHLLGIYLDGRHHLLGKKVITIGTLTSSLLHPREVFAPAIELRAASVIVVHNHPSGNVQPSLEDIQATDKLVEAGEILDIPLLDHVIVSREKWVSLRELKLM